MPEVRTKEDCEVCLYEQMFQYVGHFFNGEVVQVRFECPACGSEIIKTISLADWMFIVSEEVKEC